MHKGSKDSKDSKDLQVKMDLVKKLMGEMSNSAFTGRLDKPGVAVTVEKVVPKDVKKISDIKQQTNEDAAPGFSTDILRKALDKTSAGDDDGDGDSDSNEQSTVDKIVQLASTLDDDAKKNLLETLIENLK